MKNFKFQQEDGSTVQTMDLVADCPESIPVEIKSNSRSVSPTTTIHNSEQGRAIKSQKESINGMGQRSSSFGLLRPKISLTWVLRNQPGSLRRDDNDNDLYANGIELTERKFQSENRNGYSNGVEIQQQNQHAVRADVHSQKELVNGHAGEYCFSKN